MSKIVNVFKKLLNIELLDDEDERNFHDDILNYTTIINSSKYADSNSNTEALEKLVMAMTIGDSNAVIGMQPTNQNSPATSISQTNATEGEGVKLQDHESDSKMFNAYKGNQFVGRLSLHLKLLDELEGESASVLPGQPVYQPAKFGKEGGKNFVLGSYRIPNRIYTAMECGNINMLKLQDQMTIDNYIYRFQTLLWIEEAHQAVEMRRYDLSGVMLAKYEKDFFILVVPGLAEGRPSLVRGDRLVLKSGKRSSYYEGFIYEVREQDVKIKLHESLHTTALDGLRFDVSFLSSRTSFRRCHHGVCQLKEDPIIKDLVFPVSKHQDSMAKPMIDIKENDVAELRCFMRSLNVYQRRAVINVLKAESRPAPYIIFGPPGTGKTVTMVEAVLQVYARKKNSKILVCGNSNACADLIATRIINSGVVPKDKMVRVSAFYRMENLIPTELEDITQDMDMISASRYEKYRVVVTTCIQSGVLNEFKDRFDYVFIDEAGHANEPEALISIGLMKKNGCSVLAGDPHQLGPVCISKLAKQHGLGTSLLERLSGQIVYQRRVQNAKMVYDERYLTKLIICYRSDRRVLAVNNELFYDNELKFENKTPQRWMKFLKISHPLVFHTVKGRDRREYVNPSWFNPNEAITCLSYVNRLYGAGLKPEQLGIITPYRRQIEKLKILFESCNLRQCKIATMEEFQGDEREVIIISTVRTREKNIAFDKKFNLGFLFDPRRFNVAISRAKWLVIVVGDPQILERDDCWIKYIEQAHKFEETASNTLNL